MGTIASVIWVSSLCDGIIQQYRLEILVFKSIEQKTVVYIKSLKHNSVTFL